MTYALVKFGAIISEILSAMLYDLQCLQFITLNKSTILNISRNSVRMCKGECCVIVSCVIVTRSDCNGIRKSGEKVNKGKEK